MHTQTYRDVTDTTHDSNVHNTGTSDQNRVSANTATDFIYNVIKLAGHIEL